MLLNVDTEPVILSSNPSNVCQEQGNLCVKLCNCRPKHHMDDKLSQVVKEPCAQNQSLPAVLQILQAVSYRNAFTIS